MNISCSLYDEKLFLTLRNHPFTQQAALNEAMSCIPASLQQENLERRPQRIKEHSGLLKFGQSWTRGAQITSARSPWQLNILECCLVFVDPQYGTCFLSPFRRLELWGDSQIYEQLVHPWFWTTAGHKPHYTLPIPKHILSALRKVDRLMTYTTYA